MAERSIGHATGGARTPGGSELRDGPANGLDSERDRAQWLDESIQWPVRRLYVRRATEPPLRELGTPDVFTLVTLVLPRARGRRTWPTPPASRSAPSPGSWIGW